MSEIELTAANQAGFYRSVAASPAANASPADGSLIGPAVVEPLLIDRLSKQFKVRTKSVEVLNRISLRIDPGEFFCIVGGSGCGKSTLLRMIAGLETADGGSVSLGQRKITRPGLDRGMVFQDPRLLPWLNVSDNIGFGLKAENAKHRQRIITEHIRLVGLEGFEKAYPSQLSGGMAQRVGLARALVNRPEVLLLDEPFGALDALTRLQMQREILRIWQVERSTMILVTHDIDEAIFLGDRVAVLVGRPAGVRDLFTVPLPRPRDRGAPLFAELRQKIWDSIFDQPSTISPKIPSP
jgi:sulfonate transport system ATP-binding protein